MSAFAGIGSMEAEGAGGSFGGGDGTADYPYLIEDVWDLQNIGSNLYAYYALANDIDASETTGWNDGAGFAPIGTEGNQFTGSLDGRGYNITGLFIYRSASAFIGLFGYVDNGGTLVNVSLIDLDITGGSYVGGLVGWNEGPVSNSFATGNVNGASSGGLVGVNNGSVSDSYATGNGSSGGLVGKNTGSVSNSYATGNGSSGGLVGENTGSVSNSYATGYVSGDSSGGLVGINYGSVSNSYATGNASGSESGGLVGRNDGSVSNSSASGNVNGDMYVGGLVGDNFGPVSNSYATGNVYGGVGAGGLVGSNDGPVSDSYATGNVSGSSGLGGLLGENNFGSVSNSYATGNVYGGGGVGGLVGTGTGPVSNSYATGNVSGDYSGGLVGQAWGGSVSNSYATGNVSGNYMVGGLVGDGGSASNSYATGNIYGSSYVGGLVGRSYGSVSDSYATGNVTATGDSYGYSYVGGLVGEIYYGSVSNSSATGNVNGTDYVGGLVGFTFGSVDNSSATGNVNGGNYVGGLVGYGWNDYPYSCGSVYNSSATGNVNGSSYVGGLVGKNQGPVYNSYATGNVNGANGVGGLVGYNDYGSVYNSSATGNVNGNGSGGLVGYNNGSVSNSSAIGNVSGSSSVGGLVGNNWEGSVSNSSATGNVNGKGDYIGGLVGSNAGSVYNTSATGNVNGSSMVGGLVGDNGYGSVSNSYAIGDVNGKGDHIGGLVGNNSYGSVSNSFWDKMTSGQKTSAGGTGKTTSEMKTLKTFTDADWNFTDVWCIIEKVTYPILRWQDRTPPTADAGPNQTVDERTIVTLDGSSSTDDVGIANYTWVFNDGKGDIMLYGVAPSHTFNILGVYKVILNVTDPVGRWDTDALNVTVNDFTPPVAEAGPDQIVDEGTLAIFDGSGSTDNAGIVNYSWTFNDGTGDFTLYGAAPSHRFIVPGVYAVTLNVTDAVGLWDIDIMTLTIKDITPPVADAGPDQTVDEGTLVPFDGSASTDNVGIVNCTWMFNDGTGDITLHGTAPSHTFNVPGVYTVTLKVTDAAGLWGNDTMTVTVKDITPPVADAGPDQTVDEGTLVTFDGSASTDNVGIVNYTWTFNDGTGVITLYGTAPSHTFNVPGVHLVTLNVSDAAGLWGSDVMTVIVKDITPPVANAGPDRRVAIGSTVFLNGSLSTDNVRIKNYTWTFTYRGVKQNLEGAIVSFKFDEAGEYQIVLTVSDQYENLGNDTVTITVVDKGTVSGKVLDKIGKPVEGATVAIQASDGKAYTMTTGPNGSFSIEIPHGSFTWKISKNGYKPISGTSSVGALEEKVLDLSGSPLTEKETANPIPPLFIIPTVVLILAVIGIVVFALARKKKAEPIPEKEKGVEEE